MLFTLSLLLLTLPSAPIDESVSDDVAVEPPQLTFRDEESQAAFKRGWSEFHALDFKSAEKSFKVALDGVVTADRKTVLALRAASKNGKKVLDARKKFEKGKARSALKDLDRLEKKSGDGPLATHIAALRADIEARLYVVIEDFENRSPSGGIGKRHADGRAGYQNHDINTDPRYVRSGEKSLIWQTMAAGYDPDGIEILVGEIAKFKDTQLDEFPFMSFSMHTEKPGTFELFLFPRQRGAIREEDWLSCPALHKISVKRPGWTDIKIDLKRSLRIPQVRPKPEGRFQQVLRIRMVKPGNSQRVHFDQVRFERE